MLKSDCILQRIHFCIWNVLNIYFNDFFHEFWMLSINTGMNTWAATFISHNIKIRVLSFGSHVTITSTHEQMLVLLCPHCGCTCRYVLESFMHQDRKTLPRSWSESWWGSILWLLYPGLCFYGGGYCVCCLLSSQMMLQETLVHIIPLRFFLEILDMAGNFKGEAIGNNESPITQQPGLVCHSQGGRGFHVEQS